jgi:mannosyltransferase
VDEKNRNRLILLSLVLVGTILRFHNIASVWFGFDEAETLNLGQAHWFTFERITWVREMNMVGYYALVRLWLNLNPDLSHSTLTFVRTLSALFSIATIPTLYALGKKLFNENVGLLAAGLLAINAFHIKHAQNARSYSLFVFLVTLATLLLVDNITKPHPKWVAYTCIWVFAVYVHVFAFLFLAAHLIVMMYVGLRPRIGQLACLFATIMPMGLWTVFHHRGQPLDWVQPTTVRSVAELFSIFVGNDGFILLFIVVAAVIVAHVLRPREEQTSVKLVLAWAMAPVALAILASFVQPCFVPRFLIPCLPATTLLTAASIERIKALYAVILLALIIFGMLNGAQPIGA